jgi:TRAP-type C4-dicarboxylate transport system permease small subunit
MSMGSERPEDVSKRPAGAEPPSDEEVEEPLGLASIDQVELLPARGWPRRLLRAIGLAEQLIGGSLIVIIMVLVLVQVGQRYIHAFGGWPWTGEIAKLSLVWCTFVLSGYLMAQDRHITIRVIDFAVGGRALGLVKLFAHVVVTAGCLAMAYATYRLIADGIGERTPAAGIPVAWTYVPPLVGFVLTAVRGVMAIVLLDVHEISGHEQETT